MVLKIVPAATAQDFADVHILFGEYSTLVAEALCFQGFDKELEALPGDYAAPGGVLLIARNGDAAAGCGALRQLDAGTGEMKRMYVREAFRGSGLGRRLALAVIEEARKRKYARVMLDTLPKLGPAIALYRDLGFRETGPYLACPTPGAICFELRLS
ncbi:MAG: GNAT family N-acetyltransferase [Betaproteobacteria bacterium]|nr:GNAT family N-acetyltransferase [Betaproteobacteria bacterium]